MNLQPSHLVYLCGLVIYVSIRTHYQYRNWFERKSVSLNNLRESALVSLVAAGQIGLPLLLLFTSWLNGANFVLPLVTSWVGTPLLVMALWLFWRSHADLGKSWSVTLELRQNHRLVTQGVYRFVRHPMYASFFLFAFSQALLLNNWLAGGAALAAVTLLYWIRIPHEEQMMLDNFGDEYRSYMQSTNGILPRLTKATVSPQSHSSADNSLAEPPAPGER